MYLQTLTVPTNADCTNKTRAHITVYITMQSAQGMTDICTNNILEVTGTKRPASPIQTHDQTSDFITNMGKRVAD